MADQLSDSGQISELGSGFDPSDYLPPEISQSICPVCSLPGAVKRSVEAKIFASPSYSELVIELKAKDGLAVEAEDIKHHIETCILERDSTVPVGQLLNKLVGQLQNYILEIDRFRTDLAGERTPDKIIAYSGMLREFRMTLDVLKKLETPQNVAGQIMRHVFKPVIYQTTKSMIEKLKDVRTQILNTSGLTAEDKNSLEAVLAGMAKAWGESATQQVNYSVTKLAELMGVNPEDIQ